MGIILDGHIRYKRFPKNLVLAIKILKAEYRILGIENLPEVYHVHRLYEDRQGQYSISPLGKSHPCRILGKLQKNGDFKVLEIFLNHNY